MLFALLFAQLQEPSLQKRIDFSTPPARVENILPALSTKTGFRLTSTPETKNEILVIRVKGATVENTLEKIAEAASAHWTTTDDGYRLDRPTEIEKSETAAEFEDETKAWAQGQKVLEGELRGTKVATAATAKQFLTDVKRHNSMVLNDTEEDAPLMLRQMDALARRAPMHALPTQIALGAPPSLYASLSGVNQVVYSNLPTRMESKLTPAMETTIKAFEADQRAIADAAENQSDLLQEAQPRYAVRLGVYASKLDNPRYVIAFKKRTRDCVVKVAILNRNGENVLTMEDEVHATYSNETQPWTEAHPDDLVQFSPRVEAFQQAVRARNAIGLDVVAPTLLNDLTHPEIVDPLSVAGSDGFLSYAEISGVNLVARVTDQFQVTRFPSTSFSSDGHIRIPVKTWEQAFLRGTQWTPSKGWLLIKPRRPAEARRQQADRAALGKLFRQMAAQNGATLDQWADFQFHQPPGVNAAPQLISLTPFVQGSDDTLNGLPPEFLVFYGSLSQEDRSLVWTERGLSMANLSQTSRAKAIECLYGSGRFLSYTGRIQPKGLELFPPDGLGTGLPSGGFIRGVFESDQGAIARSSNPNNFAARSMFLDTNMIDIKATGGVYAPHDLFRPALRVSVEVQLVVMPEAYMSFQGNFSVAIDNSHFGPRSDLPPLP